MKQKIRITTKKHVAPGSIPRELRIHYRVKDARGRGDNSKIILTVSPPRVH